MPFTRRSRVLRVQIRQILTGIAIVFGDLSDIRTSPDGEAHDGGRHRLVQDSVARCFCLRANMKIGYTLVAWGFYRITILNVEFTDDLRA